MKQDSLHLFLNNAVEFMEYFRNIKKHFDYYNSALSDLDKATQDILHKFELDKISSNEKCRWATELSKIRKDRRYYKDRVETLKLIIETMDEINGKSNQLVSDINKFATIFGVARKSYLNKGNRFYSPKVIKDMTINSQNKRNNKKEK